MSKPSSFDRPLLSFVVAVVITAISSPPAGAQQLEEIIVTAQRREQSLQEVPISVDVFTGAQLMAQGISTVEDLAIYSPSVEMEVDSIRYSISVRGMGSNGPNLGLEQSATTFVDGIHYGRGSMSYGAYLDLERIEVLRGPQPVHFGQNATAGAFSLTTKKPGPVWEGDITAEVGNFGHKKAEGGIGGPVTETLGIRVAGKIGRYDGHLEDIVTGAMFPNREDNAARVTLQWAPTSNFEATLAGTYQQIETGGDAVVVCNSWADPDMTEFATFEPGLVPAWDAIKLVKPLPDCTEDGFKRIGRREGDGNPFRPVPGISQSDQRSGFVDLVDLWLIEFADLKGGGKNLEAMFYMNAKDYRLNLAYQFENGISIEATTGYVDYFRQSFDDTSGAPIMANAASRTEIFDMMSQELRVRSAAGGAIEWEAGAYWQQEDLDGDPSCESRNGLRHPIRCNYPWQDSEWKNVFGNVTFNFMDNRMSLDVGARYSKVKKTASLIGTGKTLIFDIDPDPDGNGIVEADSGDEDVTFAIIDCTTGDIRCGSYGAGYWTHHWGEGSMGTRHVPDAWNLQRPVAFGPELVGLRDREGEGPDGEPVFGFFDTYDTDSLDPQVTLRYRPNDQTSVYAKWVRAFKSGGFDTASRSIPDNLDKFTFGNEDAEAFEVGVKGTLLGNRVRYGVSAFRQRIKGLQQETNDPLQGSDITQAGLQETKGIEFSADWAAAERLTASLTGALMDGTLVEFPDAGCTDVEFANADQTDCYSEEESIAEFGDDRQTGIIDRSGYPAPRTPDWKATLSLDYWQPLTGNLKGIVNTVFAASDDYIHDVEGYSEVTKWPTHVNWNVNAGFGDLDDSWKITFYARNILGARVEYFRENDPFGTDESQTQGKSNTMGASQYFNYGIQLRYNYN